MRQLSDWVPLLAALLVIPLMILVPYWPFLGSDSPTKTLLDHQGELRTVCGKVESTHYARNEVGEPTFLNLGGRYPNQVLTVVIWGKHRSQFPQPDVFYRGRKICVKGVIEIYDGKAEFAVESPGLIQTFDPPLTLLNAVIGSGLGILFNVLLENGLQKGSQRRKRRPPAVSARQGSVQRAQDGKVTRLTRWLRGSVWRWAVVLLLGGLVTGVTSWILWR